LNCISDFYKEQLQKKSIVKLTAAPTTDNKSKTKKQSLHNIISKEIEDVADDTIVSKKQKLNILNVDLLLIDKINCRKKDKRMAQNKRNRYLQQPRTRHYTFYTK